MSKLGEKFSGLVNVFIENMAKHDQDMNYQPRIVIDDDAEDEYEYA